MKPAPEARLVDELLRGLNSIAATLSFGELNGDGEVGRLLGVPMIPGGREDIGEERVGAAPEEEARLVVDRLEMVRFHGRGEERGEPEPMTPGCGLGLALPLFAGDHAALGPVTKEASVETKCGEPGR